MIITEELAQPIVEKMMSVIDYNINIMNEEGVIVGSGDKNRINRVHKGALEALSLKREKIIYLNDSNRNSENKPGVNLPIEFNQEVIGAVGITGDPAIVYQLSQLVKITVEALIKQQYLDEKLLYRKNNIEKWILDLIDETYDKEELEKYASQLRIDVENSAYLMIIHVTELVRPKEQNNIAEYEDFQLLETRFFQTVNFHQSDVIFIGQVGEGDYLLAVKVNPIISLENINKMSNMLFQNLVKKSWTVKVATSTVQFGILGYRKGYYEALQSLKLMSILQPDLRVSNIEEWGVVRYIGQIPKEVRNRFKKSIIKDKKKIEPELFNTLDAFLQNDMKIGLTADELFIHRNTLLYRLDKINKLWNLNPRYFGDAFILQLLLHCMKFDDH